MEITALPRVFKLGALSIEDTMPQLSLDDAIRFLSKQYPQFRNTRIYPEDGQIIDGKWVFDVPMIPAKTNG